MSDNTILEMTLKSTMQTSEKPIKVAALLFDDVNAIDVTGPMEAFACARIDSKPAYVCEVWGVKTKQVRSESSVGLWADKLIDEDVTADVLLIPGGRGIRAQSTLGLVSRWLRENEHRFSRIAGICTGSYALAESGLIDGRRVATHWAFSADLQRRYPKVEVQDDALFLREGKYFSSGGVTAGIDLALDMIESDYGTGVAMEVARELVVFLRRGGAQAQFSEPLRAQASADKRLGDAVHWATNNLHKELSVEALAERANLSARQFTRRFKDELGMPPAAYVKRLRLDSARTMLSQGCHQNQVANTVGFLSLDGFRRAFEKEFGVSPLDYQRRFSEEI